MEYGLADMYGLVVSMICCATSRKPFLASGQDSFFAAVNNATCKFAVERSSR